MIARFDPQSTPKQEPGDVHAAKQDVSIIARCSLAVLCGAGPRATNLVPTPPNNISRRRTLV